MWVMSIMVIPLIIYSRDFFFLYLGEKFSLYESSSLIMILLLAYLPLSYSTIGLDGIVVATGRIQIFMVLTLISQLMNLFLTFLFVAYFKMGGVGSALATLISGVIITLFGYFPLCFKIIDVKLIDYIRKIFLPGILPSIPATFVWIVGRQVLKPTNWLSLIICVILGISAYLFILFALCLQPEDRVDFHVLVGGLLRKIR